ncbi:hypothetical protein HDV05_003848 [Chytridiales sp. JEL 0842]|nr:hypothetical protein HDV05_003848 [Chytridiales sp. JEL 0842]
MMDVTNQDQNVTLSNPPESNNHDKPTISTANTVDDSTKSIYSRKMSEMSTQASIDSEDTMPQQFLILRSSFNTPLVASVEDGTLTVRTAPSYTSNPSSASLSFIATKMKSPFLRKRSQSNISLRKQASTSTLTSLQQPSQRSASATFSQEDKERLSKIVFAEPVVLVGLRMKNQKHTSSSSKKHATKKRSFAKVLRRSLSLGPQSELAMAGNGSMGTPSSKSRIDVNEVYSVSRPSMGASLVEEPEETDDEETYYPRPAAPTPPTDSSPLTTFPQLVSTDAADATTDSVSAPPPTTKPKSRRRGFSLSLPRRNPKASILVAQPTLPQTTKVSPRGVSLCIDSRPTLPTEPANADTLISRSMKRSKSIWAFGRRNTSPNSKDLQSRRSLDYWNNTSDAKSPSYLKADRSKEERVDFEESVDEFPERGRKRERFRGLMKKVSAFFDVIRRQSRGRSQGGAPMSTNLEGGKLSGDSDVGRGVEIDPFFSRGSVDVAARQIVEGVNGAMDSPPRRDKSSALYKFMLEIVNSRSVRTLVDENRRGGQRWKVFTNLGEVDDAEEDERLQNQEEGFLKANGDIETELAHSINSWNVVYKTAPYIPNLNQFNPRDSFTEEDANLLRLLGTNAIRINVAWEGVYPQPGRLNRTYLGEIGRIMALCQKYDIYVLVEFHQDSMSERFCGNGKPVWLAKDDESFNFPSPLGNLDDLPGCPSSNSSDPFAPPPDVAACMLSSLSKAVLTRMGAPNNTVTPYTYNPSTGRLTSVRQCDNFFFFYQYASFAVSRSFQNLYDNINNHADYFIDYWKAVAGAVSGYPNLLGYEIMNEPWPGYYPDALQQLSLLDIVLRGPDTLLSGITDLGGINLSKLYERVVREAINSVDPYNLIFFEGPIFDSEKPLPFNSVPGGQPSRGVISYHFYESYLTFENFVKQRLADTMRLGNIAAFLTETNWNEGSSNNIDPFFPALLDTCDQYLQSWTIWQYKLFDNKDGSTRGIFSKGPESDMQINDDLARLVSRTYPMAVAGTILASQFNRVDSGYKLRFRFDAAVQAPTLIFASSVYHYSTGGNGTDIGFEMFTIPEVGISSEYNRTTGILTVRIDPAVVPSGAEVTIEIWKV